MSLTDKDVQALQRATLELHEPRDLDGLRAAAPDVFRGVVAAEYFVWMEGRTGAMPHTARELTIWDSPARMKLPHVRALMGQMERHPFTRAALRTGELGPFRLSDQWTPAEQRADPIQRHVYRPLGIGRLLSIAVPRGDRSGTLSLGRPPGARDFSERDRVLFGLLTPHFALALQAAERASAGHAEDLRTLDWLGLTAREGDIATWLARGRTNSEIAAILGMKPRTVEKHVENILEKLGVENRTTAARVILGRDLAGSGPVPAASAAPRARLRLVRGSRRSGDPGRGA